jgi:CDP-diacylglycerol--serine O-phosphatidyltransferase
MIGRIRRMKPMIGEQADAWSRGSAAESRRGIYILPSPCTIGNILCGFLRRDPRPQGRAGACPTPETAEPLFDHAAIATRRLPGCSDNLDGRVARLTNTTTEFGVEL